MFLCVYVYEGKTAFFYAMYHEESGFRGSLNY